MALEVAGSSPVTHPIFLIRMAAIVMDTIRQPFVFYLIFEGCSIFFELKERENFNHRHTLSISRIEI